MIVSRDVSISILGLSYLKYELSYLPVVMETFFSKLHEEQHNPIMTEVLKRNSNIRERFICFIIAMFFDAKLLTHHNIAYTQKWTIVSKHILPFRRRGKGGRVGAKKVK